MLLEIRRNWFSKFRPRTGRAMANPPNVTLFGMNVSCSVFILPYCVRTLWHFAVHRLLVATINPNKALWEKGDFTEIAALMRQSGEAIVNQWG
jgi:hypothetical protein